jgi:hypothetical protein
MGGLGNSNPAAEQRSWPAPCRDVARRRRVANVVVTEDDGVAVIVPAGDTAVFETFAELQGFRDAVNAATTAAFTRRLTPTPTREE